MPRRRVFIDVTPLRQSRDLRVLLGGQSTIIQLSVPDRLRGRLAAIQIGVVQGGPRLGDVEAGAVADAFGNEVSVISGGLACIAGALLLSRLLPGFRTVEVSADTAPRESAQAPLPIPVMLR